jgi:hypothetical protein
MVTIRVMKPYYPISIAHKWFSGFQSILKKFAIKVQSIFTDYSCGNPDTRLIFGSELLAILLEHQSNSLPLYPTPFDASFGFPAHFELETEALAIKLNGLLHVHYHKKRYSQFEVLFRSVYE